MNKKTEKPYKEIDIIIQATAYIKEDIENIVELIQEKYEGNIAEESAKTAAQEYYMFGVLGMKADPELRKKAISELTKYHKERSARMAKKNAPKEEEK